MVGRRRGRKERKRGRNERKVRRRKVGKEEERRGKEEERRGKEEERRGKEEERRGNERKRMRGRVLLLVTDRVYELVETSLLLSPHLLSFSALTITLSLYVPIPVM
ncbi:hypothetical protein Pmani_025281 [Petrolisthes manimaculis]|uniref:Uncharacterized protein n=1 Tax=Petrolisthes manimaculis TaxID=1843537 RepID=A0AAE1P710_9EUCA|nr:hypothetical protein Pmani_025281 [Petrolisthes manimaculis]